MDRVSSSKAVSGNVGVIRLNWKPDFDRAHDVAIVALDASESVGMVEDIVRRFVQDRDDAPSAVRRFFGSVDEIRQSVTANPHLLLIYVVDDPVSLALSWESAAVMALPKALDAAAKATQALCHLAASGGRPALLLSAHRAALFPAQTLDAIATFCGVHPSAAARAAAQSLVAGGASEAVVAIPDQPIIQGALDRAQKPGFIRGWAKQPLSGDRVHVHVLLDGHVVGDAIADRKRDDLIVHRVGDGRHGFLIDIAAHLTTEARDFEVTDARSGALVGRVSMSVGSVAVAVDIDD